MLIFEEPTLSVYGAPLSLASLTSARQAVASLVDEACPHARLIHASDGAPVISGISSPPSVSVSHSGSLALLAVSRQYPSIGIDTETTDRDRQLRRVLRRYLTPAQQEDWGGEAMPRLVAWCIKEAVYKCIRQQGLSLLEIPLPHVNFMQSEQSEIALGKYNVHLRLIPQWQHNGPIVAALSYKPCPIC